MSPDRERLLLAPRRDVIRAARAGIEAARLAGRPVDVRLFIDGENWFEIVPLVELCQQSGVALEVHTSDEDGRSYLADLPLEEARVIHAALASWRNVLAGQEAAACLPPGAFDALLTHSREQLLARAARAAGAPERVLRGRGGRFRLPRPDHPLFRDEARAFALLGQLFDLSHSKSLLAWVAEFVEQPDATALVAERAWLRLLLQKLAIDDRPPAVLQLLQDVYREPSARQHLLADERRAIEAHAADWGLEQWRERLGLEAQPRTRTFEQADPVAPDDAAPSVTVLVPAYRHEQWIERTLGSILAQRGVALRVLVVDDASDDGTAARARALADPRVEVVENPRNLGLGSSLNAALAQVTTPYVALLNSDDLFHPERLAQCLRVLDADAAASVVATEFEFIDASDCVLDPDNVSYLLDGPQISDLVRWFARSRPEAASGDRLFAELLQRNFLATSSNIVCRRSFLAELGPRIDGLNYCVDWCVFLAAAARGQLAHIDAPLLAYRLHAQNTVWFDRETRADYFLEVARVAADAARDRLAQQSSPEQRLALGCELTVGSLLTNTEVSGHAAFLNALLDPLALARAARGQTDVAQAVQRLHAHWSRREAAVRTSREQGDVELPELWRIPSLQLARVQAGLLTEELATVGAERNWLRSEVARLWDVVGQGRATEQELRTELAAAAHMAQGREALLSEQLTAAQQQAQSSTAELQHTRQELQQLRQDLAAEAQAGIEAAARQAALEQEHAKLQVTHHQITADRTGLEQRLHHAERDLTALRQSREFRTGNWFWNRLPLTAATAAALKSTLRRTQSWIALTRVRWSRRPDTAVVAGSERFPHWAHTFVLDDVLALRGAGLDPLLFYWTPGDRQQLPPEHAALQARSVRLFGALAVHRRDLAYWRSRQPGRLQDLVARIATACGRAPAEIEQDWDFLRACTFARFVATAQARWIHTFFFYEQSFFGMVAAALTGVPRAITAYADHALSDYRFKLVGLQVATADLVVATSARARSELLAQAGDAHAAKILVKPNGVDSTAFPPVAREQRDGRRCTLISICRLEHKKGLSHLLAALAAARAAGVELQLELVGAADPALPGSAQYEAELRAAIDRLDLREQVRMHGFVRRDALPALLAAADVFVAPYVETASGDKDGIPTSLLEAMSTALPAVVTDAGALTEAVTAEQEGIVVPQADPQALSAALLRLARNAGLRERLGRAARARIEASFARAVIDRELTSRIRTLLDR